MRMATNKKYVYLEQICLMLSTISNRLNSTGVIETERGREWKTDRDEGENKWKILHGDRAKKVTKIVDWIVCLDCVAHCKRQNKLPQLITVYKQPNNDIIVKWIDCFANCMSILFICLFCRFWSVVRCVWYI